MTGSNISDVNYVATTDALPAFDLSNCPMLQYHDITNLGGLLVFDNSYANLNDSALLAADVDAFLADILTIITTRGEGAGGDYNGRQVAFGGNNQPPTAAGLATVVVLNSNGITVSHS